MTATAHPADPLLLREPRHDALRKPDGEQTPVVVPASGRFEGLLTFKGKARIEGEFEGEIICQGTLCIGADARVDATIEVDELIVAGTLVGDAVARNRIELTATARVKGVIRAPHIALEDGCVLDGRCETGEPAPSA